ncbi:MAG: hypothetical protein JXR88_08255 [Clostridia bacterium]|nr:hypothetical protein [Clostridia bacterium]
MKKIILLIMVLLLVGCEKPIEGMVYLKDDHTVSYTDNIQNILSDLPGNLHVDTIKEEANRYSINYTVPLSREMEEMSAYWENDDAFKSIFLYNSQVLFQSNPELENVMFFLETKHNTYYVTMIRKDVEEALNYESNLKDLTKVCLKSDNVDQYYSKHSVLIFEREEGC